MSSSMEKTLSAAEIEVHRDFLAGLGIATREIDAAMAAIHSTLQGDHVAMPYSVMPLLPAHWFSPATSRVSSGSTNGGRIFGGRTIGHGLRNAPASTSWRPSSWTCDRATAIARLPALSMWFELLHQGGPGYLFRPGANALPI